VLAWLMSTDTLLNIEIPQAKSSRNSSRVVQDEQPPHTASIP
jgi:hypothetical protein